MYSEEALYCLFAILSHTKPHYSGIGVQIGGKEQPGEEKRREAESREDWIARETNSSHFTCTGF